MTDLGGYNPVRNPLPDDVEAYQRAASTALAELRLFLDTGDRDRLHSFVSWSHTADSERDKIKRAAGL